MKSNGEATKPLEFRAPGGVVGGILIGFNVQCHCGNPEILLVVMTNHNQPPTICPRCHTQFFIGRLNFDARNPQQTQLGLGWNAPQIMPAPEGLVVK